jgi:hypothetical protein
MAYIDPDNEVKLQKLFARDLPDYEQCVPDCKSDCAICAFSHSTFFLTAALRCIAAFPKSGVLNKQLRQLGMTNPFLGMGPNPCPDMPNVTWILSLHVNYTGFKFLYEIYHWKDGRTTIKIFFDTPKNATCSPGCKRECTRAEYLNIGKCFDPKDMLESSAKCDLSTCWDMFKACNTAYGGVVNTISSLLKDAASKIDEILLEMPYPKHLLEGGRIRQRETESTTRTAADADAAMLALLEEEDNEKQKMDKKKLKKKEKKQKKQQQKKAEEDEEDQLVPTHTEDHVLPDELEIADVKKQKKQQQKKAEEDEGGQLVPAHVTDPLAGEEEDEGDQLVPTHTEDHVLPDELEIADVCVDFSQCVKRSEDEEFLHYIPLCLWTELELFSYCK